MNLTEETKKENSIIEIWKFTIAVLLTSEKTLNENLNVEERAKKYAEEQYKKIYETRPKKDKTAEEQAKEQQLEFLEYLKYVMKTGKLEKIL